MPTLNRIAPELPVSNLREAIGYYEGKLGFRLVMELPDAAYAIVERDAISIHLFQDALRSQSPVGIHIFTNQLDELYNELKDRGALLSQDIIRKPWGNRDFRVNDSAGNEIKFTEPLPDEA
jgi:uncharacterized glyoxalase superfamily protein PhnB